MTSGLNSSQVPESHVAVFIQVNIMAYVLP